MNMLYARIRNAISLTIAIICLSSCLPKESPPLRVGMLVWPAYEMAFLARDLEYFEESEVKLIDYLSPADALRAYQNGSIDVVAFTADYALQALQRDPTTHIVLTIDVSLGGDSLIGQPGIDQIQQLKGKKVAIESSVLGAYMLTRALSRVDMNIDDVELIFRDIPDQELAFTDKIVDAVVTYEPTRSKLIAAGGNELFSSADIPGEIVDVLIVSEEQMKTKDLQLRKFIGGWLKAVEYFRKNPDDVAERVSKRQGLTPKQFLETFDYIDLHGAKKNNLFMNGENPKLTSTLKVLMPVMVEQEFLKRELDSSDFVTSKYISE